MTIKDCYEQMGVSYEDVVGRIGNETILKKFVLKFPDDPSYKSLQEGLAEKDHEKAFRAVHTLKGICLNLGFDNLFEPSSKLTELLRGQETTEGCETLFEEVTGQYSRWIDAIQKMKTEE